jgi:hypothetical protein
MKLGINFSIDLTKLDKTRFYRGKNGAIYANLTCFISPEEPDKHGEHGGIKESTTKEERDQGKDKELPFVGNVKAFWGEGVTIVKDAPAQSAPAQTQDAFSDDDIPF